MRHVVPLTDLASSASPDTHFGLLTMGSVDELYDLRDRQAACLVYLWGLPIVAMAQLEHAHRLGPAIAAGLAACATICVAAQHHLAPATRPRNARG